MRPLVLVAGLIVAAVVAFSVPAEASLKRVIIVDRLNADFPPPVFPKARTPNAPTDRIAGFKEAAKADGKPSRQD
jgi:hypothetical protein